MSLKKSVGIAAVALALVGGASLSMSGAMAADNQQGNNSLKYTPVVEKPLFVRTYRNEAKAVKLYVDGQWTTCLQIPGLGVPVPVNTSAGPETFALRAFSTTDCYEGHPDKENPGILLNSTVVFTGWVDAGANYDEFPDKVVATL